MVAFQPLESPVLTPKRPNYTKRRKLGATEVPAASAGRLLLVTRWALVSFEYFVVNPFLLGPFVRSLPTPNERLLGLENDEVS